MTTFNKKELLEKFNIVKQAINDNSVIDILKNLNFQVSGNTFQLIGCDSSMLIGASGSCNGDDEFHVCISPKTFALMLKAAKDEIKITPESGKLSTTSGKSKFNIPTLEVDLYPLIECDKPVDDISLKNIIGNVYKGCPKKDVRHFLLGVALQSKDGKINAVSTDGHLAMINEFDYEGEEFEIIIPTATAEYLANNYTSGFCIDGNKIKSINDETGTYMISKLIDGKYPDWRRIVPDNKSRFTCNKKELTDAVAIAKDIQHTGSVKLTGKNNELEICVNDGQVLTVTQTIDYSGDEFSFSLKPDQFVTCSGLFDNEEITIKFDPNNPKKPISSDFGNSKFLLVPVVI